MAISLSEAIKRVRKRYSLYRTNSPDDIVAAFKVVFERDFNGAKFANFIVEITPKGSMLILTVTHPAVIQELEAIAPKLINAINDELEQSLVLDLQFKVRTSTKGRKKNIDEGLK